VNQPTLPPATIFPWSRSRSMGLKLVVVCALVLVMGIPALFVDNIVQERTKRAQDVMQEVSARVGGPQTFLGPTVAIPYSVPPVDRISSPVTGFYVVFPIEGNASLSVHSEERHRSLFKVPVYQSDLRFDAKFDLSGVPSAAPAGAALDWSRAEILIGVSDPRGALTDGSLIVNDKATAFVPADPIGDANIEQRLPLTYFGAREGEVVRPNATFNVTADLRFSGAQRVAVLAYGKTTKLTAEADWPSPSFDGGFLPVKRVISAHGFSAEWSVPFIARGIRAEGTSSSVSALDRTALGVTFAEVADPYHSVSRAVKYALLFLGLLFLSYFIFEATTGRRVHPAQYILVGIAQMIFYLLLLALAEHVGFDWAFLIAGGATVLLLSANAAWIFKSRAHGFRAFGAFGLLYVLNYSLLRLEDNALLVGAVASFLAVAAVMYFTRNIDWYSSLSAESASASGKTTG
jgi:inner membrane protein